MINFDNAETSARIRIPEQIASLKAIKPDGIYMAAQKTDREFSVKIDAGESLVLVIDTE